MWRSWISGSLAGALLLAVRIPGETRAESSDVKAASAALAVNAHCSAFRWTPSSQSKYGAIIIAAELNGSAIDLQLDTGSDATIIYGTYADERGWSVASEKRFAPRALSVSGVDLTGGYVYVMRTMHSEGLRGTLGLADLSGKIVVIDYPAYRFCIFRPAEVPDEITSRSHFAHAILRNGKLFLPLQFGAAGGSDFIFDTGSSEVPLNINHRLWREVTGLAEPTLAPIKMKGSAWGKPITMDGAPPAQTEAHVGPIVVKLRNVYTKEGADDEFADEPFKVSGIIGNAPFWDGIVTLDLTPYARFGLID